MSDTERQQRSALRPPIRAPRVRSWSARYAAAPVAVVVALGLQQLVLPSPHETPFVFLFLAVAVAAWLGGAGPGYAALGLGVVAVNPLFLGQGTWTFAHAPVLRTVAFALSGGIVAGLIGSLRSTLAALDEESAERRRSEDALRVVGERLRAERDFTAAVLETAASLVIVVDPDGRVVRFNRACERLTGYAERELRGAHYEALIPPDERARIAAAFSELLGGTPNELEAHWRAKDGSRRLLAWSNTVIVGADGRVRFVVGTAIDLTERRRVEDRLRSFYLSGMLGVIHWTVDGRIIDANDKFLEMTGYDREALRSGALDWAAMTPPEWRHLDQQALVDFAATGISPAFEKEYLRRDGSRLPVIVGGAMVDEERHEGVAFVLDNTERRRVELALRAREEQLREADARKDEFLAMLSHELRNPLAPLSNSVYILHRTVSKGAQASRALAVMDRQIEHMTRLIDQLLDVTRVTRGKIRLERASLELGALVRRATEDHRSLFARSGIELRLEAPRAPLRLRGDEVRLAQILGNLLGNAAKFTGRGGHVAVELEERNGQAELRVRDDGAGIAPEIEDRLFEPFVQADHTLDRSRGGLGLGLALVKGLVELHEGTVSVWSGGVGRGAVFTVRLPLDEAGGGRSTRCPASG